MPTAPSCRILSALNIVDSSVLLAVVKGWSACFMFACIGVNIFSVDNQNKSREVTVEFSFPLCYQRQDTNVFMCH